MLRGTRAEDVRALGARWRGGEASGVTARRGWQRVPSRVAGSRHPVAGLVLGVLAALVAAALVPGAAQATPQPHVWVHYDYLVYPDGSSAAPDPAAIQRVVDAYAAHGIRLEIDEEHTAIPASDPVLVFDPSRQSSCPGMSFSALKEQYFKGHGQHDWHYGIFSRVGQVTTSSSNCRGGSSGWAELRGDDFAIALGGLRGFSPSKINEMTAGTFMHELGHNLSLRHGGGANLNWKPNYLSVMNYAFQLTGIPYASTPGAGPDRFRLDYSDETLPTLDPQHLNETVGVQGESDDWTKFISACPGADWRDCRSTRLARAGGPIDWDGDGDATETDVAVTLLDGPDCCPFPDFPPSLGGFDDWAAARSYLGDTRPRPNPPIPHEQPLLVGP